MTSLEKLHFQQLGEKIAAEHHNGRVIQSAVLVDNEWTGLQGVFV